MKRKLMSRVAELQQTSARYVAENHPNFHPVGSFVQLFLLLKRNAADGGSAGSVEVFGVEPLFSLILDYIGSYSTYVVWFFEQYDNGFVGGSCRGDVLSTHLTETDAFRSALREWSTENIHDSWEQEDDELASYMSRVQSFRPKGRRACDAVRDFFNIWGTEGVLSDRSVENLWPLCVEWQESRRSGGDLHARQYKVKELPYGMTRSE